MQFTFPVQTAKSMTLTTKLSSFQRIPRAQHFHGDRGSVCKTQMYSICRSISEAQYNSVPIMRTGDGFHACKGQRWDAGRPRRSIGQRDECRALEQAV